ncbi:hypothetical protein PSm6_48950 [Pseudomonas solani]|uniref:Uncharacterized protein n=1 Tax=Pseudomonas solani TaxID=2731552 RepID=A0ABM7LFV5_9PSED|nr:hypothetical protein PSm6_48950 [Pseudomonas solani]
MGIGLLQVVEQHPPRHAVHGQVVDHHQQALAGVAHVDQHHAQQGPVLQIQAALHLIAQRRQLRRFGQLTLRQHRFAGGRREVRLPNAGNLGEPEAQRVVPLHQGAQRLLQHIGLQGLRGMQQHRLVPMVGIRPLGVEEHPLRRQQRGATGQGALLHRCRAVIVAGDGRQGLDGLMLEQVLGADEDALLPGPADDLDGDDGVAAQFEEIVLRTHLRNTQNLLPDRSQVLLRRGGWRHIGLARLPGFRLWQRLALQLAVGT